MLQKPIEIGPNLSFATGIRLVEQGDLEIISRHGSRKNLAETQRAFRQYGFWGPDNGAVSIIEGVGHRLVGTAQYFRPGPTVCGFELAYAIYELHDRNLGFSSKALRLFSDLLFEERPAELRHQLVIGVANLASCTVAERCGFTREGRMRVGDIEDGGDAYLYSRLRSDWLNSLLV